MQTENRLENVSGSIDGRIVTALFTEWVGKTDLFCGSDILN